MKTWSTCVQMLAFAGLLFLFQNCSPVSFAHYESVNSEGGGAGGDGDPVRANCHSVFNSVQTPIELIFVVDVSSSNKSTDPDQSVRAESIERFYQEYKAKTNFTWDVLSFAGSTATIRAEASGASSVEDFVSWLYAYPHDVKGTPYGAALTATGNLIANDAHAAADKKYVVVFLSDGRPSGSESDSYWSSEAAKIAALIPGRVSFNTIYYGDNDPNASGLLKSMAEAGDGNFLDTNQNPSGKTFDIADLAIVPGEICQ